MSLRPPGGGENEYPPSFDRERVKAPVSMTNSSIVILLIRHLVEYAGIGSGIRLILEDARIIT